MFLEEAWEIFEGMGIGTDLCEDELEELIQDETIDPLDRDALEVILDNI
jgi:hypothetical protein